MYRAHIILIPTPGKDPKFCTSYRPITLLNYDFKIPTCVSHETDQILTIISCIDQIGFVPRKSSYINLRRVLTHLQLPPSKLASRVLALLDIEKAFDSEDWVYMSAVPEVMVFGPHFRNQIKILYRAPLAQTKLGVELSEVFPIGRGTRQGCSVYESSYKGMATSTPRVLTYFFTSYTIVA